jgi:hypothetical protein
LFGKGSVQVFQLGIIQGIFGQPFAIKIEGFAIAKNNWRTKIQQAAVGEGFYQQFYANTIQVAGSETNYWFLSFVAH